MRLLVAALWALLSVAALAEERPPTAAEVADRRPFVEAIANLRRIQTPNGIEEMRKVRLGGVEQWITIRGRDRANPVLLVIHGGPGTPTMPLSWAYQGPWEDYFTVVNWEQRGAGKNWQTTNADELAKTMSIDRLVSDASELTDLLRRDLGKRKVIVLGFSFGSRIGTQLALQRPDAVAAYVGVGQMFDQAEREVFAGTLARAQAAGDTEALAGLAAIAPHPAPDGSVTPRGLVEVRRWAKKHNGGWYGWPDLQLLYQLPILSPEYDAKDLTGWPIANGWFGMSLNRELLKGGNLAAKGFDFKVPVIFLMGRNDLMTPYANAKTYFDRISAPHKKLVTFENSAHFVMLEEPGRFFLSLVNDVRPFAVEGTVSSEAAPR